MCSRKKIENRYLKIKVLKSFPIPTFLIPVSFVSYLKQVATVNQFFVLFLQNFFMYVYETMNEYSYVFYRNIAHLYLAFLNY